MNQIVIPAKAGIYFSTAPEVDKWVPAFAGTTAQNGGEGLGA